MHVFVWVFSVPQWSIWAVYWINFTIVCMENYNHFNVLTRTHARTCTHSHRHTWHENRRRSHILSPSCVWSSLSPSHVCTHVHTHPPPLPSMRHHDSSGTLNTFSMQSEHWSMQANMWRYKGRNISPTLQSKIDTWISRVINQLYTQPRCMYRKLHIYLHSCAPAYTLTNIHTQKHIDSQMWIKYRAYMQWHSDLQRNPHTLSACSTGPCASRKAMQYSWLSHWDTWGRMEQIHNSLEGKSFLSIFYTLFCVYCMICKVEQLLFLCRSFLSEEFYFSLFCINTSF